jgi:anti-anti-sigma factor
MPYREPFQLVREDVADGVSVVAVRGEADRFRADELGGLIDDVRRNGRAVVVDLSDVTYLDSTTVATLVAASEQGRRRGAAVVIVSRSDRLRRSLQLKGLDKILTLAETREQALELLRPG